MISKALYIPEYTVRNIPRTRAHPNRAFLTGKILILEPSMAFSPFSSPYYFLSKTKRSAVEQEPQKHCKFTQDTQKSDFLPRVTTTLSRDIVLPCNYALTQGIQRTLLDPIPTVNLLNGTPIPNFTITYLLVNCN